MSTKTKSDPAMDVIARELRKTIRRREAVKGEISLKHEEIKELDDEVQHLEETMDGLRAALSDAYDEDGNPKDER